MPVSFAQRAAAHSDAAMVVYLEPWLRDRHVAFVGPRLKPLARLREVAASLEAYRFETPGGALVPVRRLRRRGAGVERDEPRFPPPDHPPQDAGGRDEPQSGFSDADEHVPWKDAAFDVVLVTELDAAANPAALLEEAARATRPDGCVVAGSTALGHEQLQDLMAARFASVHLLGEAPFTAYSVFRCDESDDPGDPVTLDDSLAGGRDRAVERFWAVGSQQPVPLDGYAVIQVPRDVLPMASAEGRAPQDQDTDVRAREVAELESRLMDRGRVLRERDRELQRHRVLARDILERIQGGAWRAEHDALGGGAEDAREALEHTRLRQERDAAMRRAVEAEASSTEAQFRLDEVAGHLAALRAGGDAVGRAESGSSRVVDPGDTPPAAEAEVAGRVRGLLARNAALEEALQMAHARRVIAEQDLEAARAKLKTFEREALELRERFEAEVVRAQGASRLAGPPASQARASGQAGEPGRVEAAQRLAGRRAGAWLAARDRASTLEAERDRLSSRNHDVEQRLAGLVAERESLEETLVVARGEAERKERQADARIAGLERALDEARAALASLGSSVQGLGGREAAGRLDVPEDEGQARSSEPSREDPGESA